MSDGISMQSGGAKDTGFTIKTMAGCRLVFGPIPLSELGMLTHGFSKRALMDAGIADRIGASLVIGEPGALDELRKLDLPVSEKRHNDYLAAHDLELHDVAMWLRGGERGASSNAMCKRIFGVPLMAKDAYPHDPADLRRCLAFLDATNAHDKVSLMADVSPEWARLVLEWDRLVALFAEESLAGKSAPKTYALMREILAK